MKLYIDDNPLDLAHAKELYDIETAENVSEAFNILKNKKIDEVICDVHLGYVSGFDAIKMLRKQYPDIKYYLTSGVVDVTMMQHLKELDLAGFYDKPLNFKVGIV